MADVELLPLPECDVDYTVSYSRAAMHAYARANVAPLQAENERLRAEVGAGDRNLAAAMSAVAALEAQAGRLAEALRGMLDVAEESFANRTYVPINCPQVAKAYAELAQEDSNG